MKFVGVNLSDNSVEAVELQQGVFGLPDITAVNRAALLPGCIEQGQIRDSKTLTEQLRQLMTSAQPHPIVTNAVALAIPESQIFSRLLSFAQDVSAAQIEATITDQFSRYLPFELTEVAYDHISLGRRGVYQDVLLVAVQRTVLQAYEALLQQLNWKIVALELESISSARAVIGPLKDSEMILLLDVGAATTIASWFDAQGLRYTFNTSIAGNYFTQQLVEQQHITFAEAETKKCRSGVVEAPAAAVVQQAWQPLIKQIEQGIQYVQTTLGLSTSEVRLIGGSAQLPGITDWLSQQLNHPVILPTLLPNLKKNDMVQVIQREGSVYYNALGLALGLSKNQQQRAKINFYRHK